MECEGCATNSGESYEQGENLSETGLAPLHGPIGYLGFDEIGLNGPPVFGFFFSHADDPLCKAGLDTIKARENLWVWKRPAGYGVGGLWALHTGTILHNRTLACTTEQLCILTQAPRKAQ